MKKSTLLFTLLTGLCLLFLGSCNFNEISHDQNVLAQSQQLKDDLKNEQAGIESKAPGSTLQPERFYLDFVDAYLVYVTSSGTLQIGTEGNILSYGTGFSKKKIYSYLYDIKYNSWTNKYWRVNTSRKKVNLMNGGNFGRIGDTPSRTLSQIKVDVVGNPSSPTRFLLRFKKSSLRYTPSNSSVRIYAQGFLVSNGSDWQKCKVKSYLYHIKQKYWKNFYWKINTSRKSANRVRGTLPLCQMGGTLTKLKMGVRVVEQKEDLIYFNPNNIKLKKINNRWKIVEGNHWIFDFNTKYSEALKSYRIIKHYKMNAVGYVGRPNPSFQYLLVRGASPQGPYPGEDAIGFNLSNIKVKFISGRWKIVDGNHWMFDFANKESEARKAYNIIKKYGFKYSCFVGRPGASFTYLRK